MSSAVAHMSLPRLAWLSIASPSAYGDAIQRVHVPAILVLAAALLLFIAGSLLGPLLLGSGSQPFSELFFLMAGDGVLTFLSVLGVLLLIMWISKSGGLLFIDDLGEAAFAVLAVGVIFMVLQPLVYALGHTAYMKCMASDYAQTYTTGPAVCLRRATSAFSIAPVAMIGMMTRSFYGLSPQTGIVVALLAAVAVQLSIMFAPVVAFSLLG